MAERAFKGTFAWDNSPGATTSYAAYFFEKQGGWQRDPVQVPATLSLDHRHQIPGVKFNPVNFRFRGLTTALKLTINTACDAGTLQEVVYRPLTGAKSATNPEETYQFYILNGATAPMNLTEDYVYETGTVEAVGAKWDDGTTSITWGTIAT